LALAIPYGITLYGAETKWYKHITANPEIELSIGQKKVRAQARHLLNAQQLANVTDRFRAKNGALERYYRKLDVAIEVNVEHT